MFPAPWNWILTACFVATGLFCLRQWIGRSTGRGGDHGRDPSAGPLVDANHALMSVCMLAMIWLPFGTAGNVVQSIAFAALGLGLLALSLSARPRILGVDGITHVLLNAAMIWMLLAMPTLMGSAGASSGSGGHHHGGHGDAAGAAHHAAAVPAWATVTNTVVIVLSVLVALWWAWRTIRGNHRLHGLCHLLMAGGMAAMLALM